MFCCCHAPIFCRVFCCRFWGTPIQNHKPTIVIACSVTSRAELVLLLYESEGRASIVGVEEGSEDRLHAPAQGEALQAADTGKVLCVQRHPFIQEIASLALELQGLGQ